MEVFTLRGKNKPGYAARTRQVTSFLVMDILEKAQQMEAQGENIIHLEIGEPDFDTPLPIKEAAMRALKAGDTHYTHSLGKMALREAVANFYRDKYGVDLFPEQIIITSGSSPGMLLAFSVLIERGDEVILPDPHYACYPNFVRYLEGRPIFIPVRAETGFKYLPIDVEKAINARTAFIMLNSPANPTGSVLSARDLQELAALGQMIVSDEIYAGLVYGEKQHSILEYTRKAFVIGGFSKVYAMTGWRLGYIIAPQEYIRPQQKLLQNFFISASSFVQQAAITALEDCDSHVTSMVEVYDRRRRYLLERLRKAGIAPPIDPQGAFYVLANVGEYTTDSLSFALDILEKAKIAVAPGIDFGQRGEGHLRLSYANTLENIEEGMNRLETYLNNVKG
ncbi:MAG TPA: pyridoxal phosphate-dependent aminotransferase [Firmicutes bacterium]|nr:pyridoxal phosphate-dependent aminotransferase [Bacillota bacterium]